MKEDPDIVKGMAKLSINWNRAIHVHGLIDDNLVRSLTPNILSLRQESDDPITVGIDSPGGEIKSLNVLLELLTGPNRRVAKGTIVTVVTGTVKEVELSNNVFTLRSAPCNAHPPAAIATNHVNAVNHF